MTERNTVNKTRKTSVYNTGIIDTEIQLIKIFLLYINTDPIYYIELALVSSPFLILGFEKYSLTMVSVYTVLDRYM